MKSPFRSYQRPSKEEYKELWRRGTFIFDTNVLLELYSYPERTRETMFGVLQKIGPRVWIPYHVALEFHRNRLSRITQSAAKLDQLERTIQDARKALNEELAVAKLAERELGLSDLHDRLKAVEETHLRLLEAVELAKRKLPTVSLEDPVRDRLYQIFEGRVGPPPEDQSAVEQLTTEASQRIKCGIPPGYRDSDKDVRYRDNGLDYEGKYGDFLVWKQLLAKIEAEKLDRVVFITGDSKDDWWLRHCGKTLGPRPELVQEALSYMKDGVFWMYQTHQFLEIARDELKAAVPDEAIDRVKAASEEEGASSAAHMNGDLVWVEGIPRGARYYEVAFDAVRRWVLHRYPGMDFVPNNGFPDLVLGGGNKRLGFEIKLHRLRNPDEVFKHASEVLSRGQEQVSGLELDEFWLVYVLPDRRPTPARVKGVREALLKAQRPFQDTKIALGQITDGVFRPLLRIATRQNWTVID